MTPQDARIARKIHQARPTLPHPDKNADLYLHEHGECPKLGVSPLPPWRYYGWLRLVVQGCHRVAAQRGIFPDRWEYFLTMLRDEKIIGEIPRVEFRGYHGEALKNCSKALDSIERSQRHGWTALQDFVVWLAYGLGVSDVESELDDTLQEELCRSVDLGLWLKEPSDYLGTLACERMRGGPNAFFPTPHEVCEMMIAMQIDPRQDNRGKSVCDPALGTGRMLLHASNHCLRLAGQDIDAVVLQMAKINGAVYAPWMIYPVDVSWRHVRGRVASSIRRNYVENLKLVESTVDIGGLITNEAGRLHLAQKT